jgi:hypothetical protein
MKEIIKADSGWHAVVRIVKDELTESTVNAIANTVNFHLRYAGRIIGIMKNRSHWSNLCGPLYSPFIGSLKAGQISIRRDKNGARAAT